MANDFFNSIQNSKKYKVIGGILSPVSDGYGKASLISGQERIEMCRLATEDHPFISVESWETLQSTWTPTLEVLKHFEEEFCKEIPSVKIILLCGSDLIEGFKDPNIWNPFKLKELLESFGLVIIERKSSNLSKSVEQIIFESDLLYQSRENIFIIPQFIPTEVSSSKLRLLIKRRQSIKYLTHEKVVDYIENNQLYR